VGSFLLEDGSLCLFLLSPYVLQAGPALVEIARSEQGWESLRFDEGIDSFPRGGFHIDVRLKRVTWWSICAYDSKGSIAHWWPGWRVQWLGDNFEPQLAAAGGRLHFSTDQLVEKIEAMLRPDPSPGGSGRDTVLTIVEPLIRQGHQIEVNPYALHDSERPGISGQSRSQILDGAIAAWRQARSGSGRGPDPGGQAAPTEGGGLPQEGRDESGGARSPAG
jgi:hypothetical protein